MDPIAARVLRNGTLESVHRAHIAVVDPRGRTVATYGNPRFVTFLRSAAKPMQALALLESGAADRYGVTEEELTLVCGSHNGEDRHVALVQGFLERLDLGVESLQCGAHAPYSKPQAERLGKNYTPLHSNCSGKHVGMLATCLHKGWDPKTYLEPSHPVQRMILGFVSQETGVPEAEIQLGVDGCGVPCFALPLRSAARAFARLVAPQAIRGDRGRSLRRLRDAMLRYPDLVAGADRLDTEFMRAFPGQLLVKAGAEACYGFGLPVSGWGGVLKVEDGGGRAVGPVLWRTLEELGATSVEAARVLERYRREPIRNVAGRVVGGITADFHLARPRRVSSRPSLPA